MKSLVHMLLSKDEDESQKNARNNENTSFQNYRKQVENLYYFQETEKHENVAAAAIYVECCNC